MADERRQLTLCGPNRMLVETVLDKNTAIPLYGDDAPTNFTPEESEHVALFDRVMRRLNALKAGRGKDSGNRYSSDRLRSSRYVLAARKGRLVETAGSKQSRYFGQLIL
jgi:hypothetical protein